MIEKYEDYEKKRLSHASGYRTNKTQPKLNVSIETHSKYNEIGYTIHFYD